MPEMLRFSSILPESDRNWQNRPVRPVLDQNRFKPEQRTVFDRFRTEPVFFLEPAGSVRNRSKPVKTAKRPADANLRCFFIFF
jgi:hypothetical protein